MSNLEDKTRKSSILFLIILLFNSFRKIQFSTMSKTAFIDKIVHIQEVLGCTWGIDLYSISSLDLTQNCTLVPSEHLTHKSSYILIIWVNQIIFQVVQ